MKNFSGVILCGGRSLRMGQPKALLTLGDRRLIDIIAGRLKPQVDLLMVNANDSAIFLGDAPVFPDQMAGFKGPLAGIHASLIEARKHRPQASHVLIAPVDCPFLPQNLGEKLLSVMKAKDSVAVASSRGKIHPVIGLWPISLIESLQTWLESGNSLSVGGFLKGCAIIEVPFEDLSAPNGPVDPFFNINTPSDLAVAREQIR